MSASCSALVFRMKDQRERAGSSCQRGGRRVFPGQRERVGVGGERRKLRVMDVGCTCGCADDDTLLTLMVMLLQRSSCALGHVPPHI